MNTKGKMRELVLLGFAFLPAVSAIFAERSDGIFLMMMWSILFSASQIVGAIQDRNQ